MPYFRLVFVNLSKFLPLSFCIVMFLPYHLDGTWKVGADIPFPGQPSDRFSFCLAGRCFGNFSKWSSPTLL